LAPIPLPGHHETAQIDQLLNSAYERLDGNRKSDAEAGALALQVLCRESVKGSNQTAIQYIKFLLARLEDSIEVAERELLLAMQKQPMHGTLLAIA
jgi:hypothetical protein